MLRLLVIMWVCAALQSPVSPRSKEPLSVTTELLDGTHWVTTSSKPFRVRVTLRNRSNKPIILWDQQSAEGGRNISFLLKTKAGKEIALHRPPIVRAGGFPTASTLQPQQSLSVVVDMAPLEGAQKLPEGPLKLRAVFSNTKSESPPITGVWVGRVVSAWTKIN